MHIYVKVDLPVCRTLIVTTPFIPLWNFVQDDVEELRLAGSLDIF